jgi:hypothetical protein
VSQLPDALLRLSRALLASAAVPVPVSVRTAALLGRMALEYVVAARLAADLPGAEAGSMRAQLLCLRSLDERLGEDAAHLHGALSDACHHHPYELGPSVETTVTLLDAVERLTSAATVPAHAADSGPRTDRPGA